MRIQMGKRKRLQGMIIEDDEGIIRGYGKFNAKRADIKKRVPSAQEIIDDIL